MNAESVRLDEIQRQRQIGWPDFHPEAFCHRCGHRNPCWFTPDHEAWRLATLHIDVGVVAILCPGCFIELWERNTGKQSAWSLTPETNDEQHRA